ncbi:hypothetical protein BY996DRAFT_6464948 [Phakopsora pachyrhizi]|nr:hypothetical protein BY996DRAFT_6464948 [Phakopsora pachyrhizi]
MVEFLNHVESEKPFQKHIVVNKKYHYLICGQSLELHQMLDVNSQISAACVICRSPPFAVEDDPSKLDLGVRKTPASSHVYHVAGN